MHWLPVDDSRCYSFPELKWALAQENSSARGLLRRFLALCACILELVRHLHQGHWRSSGLPLSCPCTGKTCQLGWAGQPLEGALCPLGDVTSRIRWVRVLVVGLSEPPPRWS